MHHPPSHTRLLSPKASGPASGICQLTWAARQFTQQTSSPAAELLGESPFLPRRSFAFTVIVLLSGSFSIYSVVDNGSLEGSAAQRKAV